MSPSEGAAERCSPWGQEPDRLWSFLDVVEKFASLFVEAFSVLSAAKMVCLSCKHSSLSDAESRGKVSLITVRALNLSRTACIKTNLIQVIPEIDRLDALRISIIRGDNYKIDKMYNGIVHLIDRIRDELNSEYFLHVQRTDLKLYGKKELFGPLVSKHFPNSTSDIEAAGNCLALEQPTACVFHLMRVMEKGTQTFGKKLKVKIDPEIESWNTILNQVDVQMKQLLSKTSKQKSRKADFAEVSSYLRHVKIAWRNEVMHPKATYTQEEARDVFAASRAFMVRLSEVL